MNHPSFGSDSGNSPPSSATDASARDTVRDSPADAQAELLRHVIEETLGAATLDEPVDQRDVEALRAVAVRYAGQSLCLNPIAVELVRALLTRRWGATVAAAHLSLDDMAWEIAAALLDAPASRARVRQLWLRLGEVLA